MKMQNAEMEFVSFDAQDVIATSGSFSMYAQGLVINAYNSDESTTTKLQGTFTNNSYYTFRLDKDTGLTGQSDKPNGIFVSDFPYSSESSLLNDYRIKALRDNNRDFKKLESVKDILAWVNANIQ